MKNLLITGGAGFIGSHFVRYIKNNTSYNMVNLDLLTYAGNLDNLADVQEDTRYVFVKGDIRDRMLLDKIFALYHIDAVINFAAESHVDRSIEQPEVFLNTNILGTAALLDTAKYYWKKNREDQSPGGFRENTRFIQISTDEVYGALGPKGKFTEESPLAPNSPYSASKASADMLVRAYYETYGLPACITRCSNNYGPYQYPEKLIPLMIGNAVKDIPLPVYGDGLQIRDWLHVEDHCKAIHTVLEKGILGQVYNIGGNNEWANINIVKLILKELGKPESLISYVTDRPGHDRRYAIDNTKIITRLGWSPDYTFEEGIKETIDWYLKNEGRWEA